MRSLFWAIAILVVFNSTPSEAACLNFNGEFVENWTHLGVVETKIEQESCEKVVIFETLSSGSEKTEYNYTFIPDGQKRKIYESPNEIGFATYEIRSDRHVITWFIDRPGSNLDEITLVIRRAWGDAYKLEKYSISPSDIGLRFYDEGVAKSKK